MNRQGKRTVRAIIALLCCISIFLTSYLLRLPAQTASSEAHCGMIEHSHTDTCYENRLICGLEETPETGQPTDITDAVGSPLGQGAAEGASSGSGAGAEAAAGVSPESGIGTEELAGGSPQAGAPAEQEKHVHTEACYEKVLICTIPEHIHDKACYEAPTVEAAGQAEQPGPQTPEADTQSPQVQPEVPEAQPEPQGEDHEQQLSGLYAAAH